MLHCYQLALCAGSSLDSYSNNFTLFSLIETLGVPVELLGLPLNLEVHFYWCVEEEGQGQDFELRLLRVSQLDEEDAGEPIAFSTQPLIRRHRIRTQAFRLPRAYGMHRLYVEWRKKGEENWKREVTFWPLDVEPRPTPTPS